ncbi:HD-GYP domain-containing protein [Thalassospira alkalitolerans]|uniref:HD-GYP domain-containing protein n=1 Tax=Thalassospira alkalitolerans TaxID=1293890 RepID=UPI003AA8B32D
MLDKSATLDESIVNQTFNHLDGITLKSSDTNILHVICEHAQTKLMPTSLLGFDIRVSSIADKIPLEANSIIIDVDLNNTDTLAKLAAFRKNAPSRCKQIFAITKGNLQEELQARTLGGRKTIYRPLGDSALAQVIEELRALSGMPVSATKKAVNTAAKTLEHTFARFGANQPVDLGDVASTGEEIANTIDGIGVNEWLSTVRAYHQTTFQHILIVTGLACSFASSIGMRRVDIEKLTIAGLLHDIGKVDIPAEILDKPGKLTPEEFDIVRTHPRAGYRFLAKQEGISEDVLDAILHHHEFLDGSGYPDGLAHDQIRDLTRILTVCDIMGALLERRSYKEPFTVAQSLAILLQMARKGKLEKVLVHALGKALENNVNSILEKPDEALIALAPLYLSPAEMP